MAADLKKKANREQKKAGRKIETRSPSFPRVALDKAIRRLKRGRRWQVVCGDSGKYRVGIYSPEVASVEEIREFERHSCDEFFLLLEGEVTLAMLVETGRGPRLKELPLRPLEPVFVRGWHAGFCPKGAFTGLAVVVERDHFTSWMRPNPWKAARKKA
jgi:hypothetical protein